ncbi:MAG: hypothetical protein VKJ64_03285 [Leptolyngbyaceae bacterium]|nr:hypothetical protein [Leptolyngbyaceae bacterium]
MAGSKRSRRSEYKEYRSASEFPLHTDGLSREEMESAYHDLRNTYKSLVLSRGQLVRRQQEAKSNLQYMSQSLMELTQTLEQMEAEKQRLKSALAHNEGARQQLEQWSNHLRGQVADLTEQMNATTKLIGDFEQAYEEIKNDDGLFSVWRRFQLLLQAANKLLTTDIRSLIPQSAQPPQTEEWLRETPETINRSLLDK